MKNRKTNEINYMTKNPTLENTSNKIVEKKSLNMTPFVDATQKKRKKTCFII